MPHTPKNLSQNEHSFLGEDVSSGSDMTMSDTQEKVAHTIDFPNLSEEKNTLKYTQELNLSLLRHFPYIENAAYDTYSALLEKKIKGEKIDDELIENAENECDCEDDFDRLPKRMQETISGLLQGGSNTLVIYDATANEKFDPRTKEKIPGTGRIFVTIEALKKKFPVRFHSFDGELQGSDKKEWILDNQTQLSANLSKVLSSLPQGDLLEGIARVVIVSNRSYVSAFHLANKTKDISMEDAIDHLGSIGAVSYTGKYIPSSTKDAAIFDTLPDSMRYTKSNFYAYQKTKEIQSRSLEKKSWKGKESDFVLDRQLYRIEETNGDKDDEEMKIKKEYPVALTELFHSSRTGKDGKYILQEHVGSGKSFMLSEVVRDILSDTRKRVVYLEGGNLVEKDGKEMGYEDMKQMFKNASENDVIVCIDAIDEIRDEDMKKLIIKELEVFTGRCYITARKSEFFNESCFTFLKLELLDTQVFLRSRFDNSPEGKGKIQEIMTKLTTMNIHTEIQGNPLLLSFVVMLAKLTDGEMKKYRDKGIMAFQEIQTKTDLYESVIRLTLVEHELLSNDADAFNDNMDHLGEFAYYLFKKNTTTNTTEIPKPPKKTILHSLNILFSVDGKGEYSFIHNSFYEFFLARYLVKMENEEGGQVVCNYRDNKKIGNWNDWRDFRPVVLFYGEMLSKERRWNELDIFLGKRGLLKDDDIFGENFFLGLEMLHKFPKDIRQKNLVKELFNRYETAIERWSSGNLYKNFEGIKKFIKSMNYADTRVSSIVISKLQNKLELLMEVNTPKAIALSVSGAKRLMATNNYFNSLGIYKVLAKSSDPHAIACALLCAEKLVSKKKFSSALTLYKVLAKNSHPDAIAGSIAGAKGFMRTYGFFYTVDVYKILAKNSHPDAISGALLFVKKLIEEKDFRNALEIYSGFSKNSHPDIISSALLHGEKLYEERNFRNALDIYLGFIKNNHSDIISNILLCAERLMEEKDFYNAARAYKRLAQINHLDAITGSISGVEKLIKEDKFLSISDIYKILAKNSHSETITLLLSFAQKFVEEKDFYHASNIYYALVGVNNSEAIKGLQLCAQGSSYEQSFYHVSNIKKVLMDISNSEKKDGTTLLGGKIQKKKRVPTVADMYQNFFRNNNHESAKGLLLHIERLINEKKFTEVHDSYSKLQKLPIYIPKL